MTLILSFLGNKDKKVWYHSCSGLTMKKHTCFAFNQPISQVIAE